MHDQNGIARAPINSIIPRADNPFYIVAPAYSRISAGVTIMHVLCHYLNMAGESAFMLQWPPLKASVRGLPSYMTLQGQGDFPAGLVVPPVTQDVLRYYDDNRLNPIVIYPEVFDNPVAAGFFGRYILNYPGKLNAAYKSKENFSFAYHRTVADICTKTYPDHPAVTDVLYIPTPDLDFWNTRHAAVQRKGACYYAGKLKQVHGQTVSDVPPGTVEILRSDKMTRQEVRALFWQSEVFYCYEDSALSTEAMLCGCPTAFIPNDYYSGMPMGVNEIGTNGWCIGYDTAGLDHARATVTNVETIVRSYMTSAPAKIARLAAGWKQMPGARDYTGPIVYPYEPRLVYFSQKLTPAPQGAGVDFVLTGQTPLPDRLIGMVSSGLKQIAEKLREKGLRGVAGDVVSSLKQHGPVGFARQVVQFVTARK